MNLLQQTATLTHADAKKHLEIPFEMPAGATQLAITLEFSPLHKEGVKGRNMLCLTLFDPDGFRGAGHNKRDNNVSLSAVAATPGYTPGPLQAGGWRLVIDTHMVLPGSIVEYQLSIDVSDQPVAGTPRHWAKPNPTPRGAGWYRGDLHAHTIHSDASWDVTDLVKEAKERGLDFVTLSDHNTMSPLAEMDSLASDKLLTIGGMELTTYYGHALALGIRHWIDWRIRPGERTMVEIAADVVNAGGTFIIAHPMSPGDPECTGCDWRYFEMMPGTARLVEVWNGGEWSDYNERGLQLWYVWLNQGHHLTCTAGTDAHGPAALDAELGFNVVYAHELSEAGILAGIRAGHSYLSSGPTLSLLVKNEHGEEASLGESLAGEQFSVHCGWSRCAEEDQIRLIGDGKVIATQNANGSGNSEWRLSAKELLWCLVEVRGADGRLSAVTNPIWLK